MGVRIENTRTIFCFLHFSGRASVKVSGSGSWRSPAGAQWPVKCGGGEQIGIPMSAAALAGCDENANANVDGDYGVGVGSPLLAQRSHSGRSAASGVTGTQPVADAEEGATGELEEECHGEEGSEDEFGFTTTRGHRRRLPNGRGPSAPIAATAIAPNGYTATQCCARRHSNDDQSQSCTDCEQCRREREATAVPTMSQVKPTYECINFKLLKYCVQYIRVQPKEFDV